MQLGHIITQVARTISAIQVVYTANWVILYASNYHRLREPETAIAAIDHCPPIRLKDRLLQGGHHRDGRRRRAGGITRRRLAVTEPVDLAGMRIQGCLEDLQSPWLLPSLKLTWHVKMDDEDQWVISPTFINGVYWG